MDIVDRNKPIYYLTQLFHSLIFTIPIWIVYYQARISVVEISLVVTIQYIAQMVLELPSGALADLIGRRKTNLIGFGIGAISYLLFPAATNMFHFSFLAFLIGMSDSFRSGSEEALLYDSYKQADRLDEYAKTYANGNMIYQAGLIISTAAGGFIYEYNQFLPFILYGVSLLLGSAAIFFYQEPYIDSETFSLRSYLRQISIGSREAFKNNYSKYLSLFYVFVGGISWSSTLYFNGYLMIDLGFNDSQRGYLIAAMRFINVVLIASLLKNNRLFNWSRTVLFFPIIMLFAYLPGRYLDGFGGLPFVQAAMIATTARWIILSPLTNEVFSSKYRATAISFLSLLIGVVYISLTSISGSIIDNFGIKSMYSVLGIVSLFTVVPVTIQLLRVRSEYIKLPE